MKYLRSVLVSLALGLATSRAVEPAHESKIVHIKQVHHLTSDLVSAISSNLSVDVLKKSDPDFADAFDKSMKARRLSYLMTIYADVRNSQEKIDKTLDDLIKKRGSIEVCAEGFTDVEEPYLKDIHFLEGKYFERLIVTEQILEKQGLDLPISTNYCIIRAINDIAKEYLKVRDNKFSTPLELFDTISKNVVEENLDADLVRISELTEQYLKENGIEANTDVRKIYQIAFTSRISINNYKHDLLKVLIEDVDRIKDIEGAHQHFNAYFNKIYKDRKAKFAPYRLVPGAALVKAMHGELTLHHLDKNSLIVKAVESLRECGSFFMNPEFYETIEEREDYIVERLSHDNYSVIIMGAKHDLRDNVQNYMTNHPNYHISLEVIDDR